MSAFASRTGTQLITDIRSRTDRTGDTFVTDTELLSWINQSCAELYGLICEQFGEDHFVTGPTTLTATGAATIALPSDFFKCLGLDMLWSGRWITVQHFDLSERNRYAPATVTSPYITRFRISGSNVLFDPIPVSGTSFRIWYVPLMIEMTTGSVTADPIAPWLEYVIVDCALKVRQKCEESTVVEREQKDAMIARIKSEASRRNVAPKRIACVERAWNTTLGNTYPGYNIPYDSDGFFWG